MTDGIMNSRLFFGMATMAMALCFTACSDDDEPGGNGDNGSGEVEATSITGSFSNGDYTAYDSWTYINLETGETETQEDATEWVYTDGSIRDAYTPENLSIEWHIAIHRYEIKTNGGSAYDTEATDMNAITTCPTGVTFTADTYVAYGTNDDLEVITDMTNMMSGSVGYASNPQLNIVLCGWVEKTATGSMPPTLYTPTGHVYVVTFEDGGWAKLLFSYAGNTTSGSSGYITWNYEYYPAE